jgi:hypothetical protein
LKFFFGDYQPSEELSAILEEKSGKTTNGLKTEVGEVPTKRSSDHDPMIRHCRIIGRFES